MAFDSITSTQSYRHTPHLSRQSDTFLLPLLVVVCRITTQYGVETPFWRRGANMRRILSRWTGLNKLHVAILILSDSAKDLIKNVFIFLTVYCPSQYAPSTLGQLIKILKKYNCILHWWSWFLIKIKIWAPSLSITGYVVVSLTNKIT